MHLSRRDTLLLVGSFAAGALVALAALPLVPDVHVAVGPGRLVAGTSLGASDTVIAVAPLGTVSADTHSAPVRLSLSLGEIDLPSLGQNLVDPVARVRLVGRIESELRGLAYRLLAQMMVGGAVIGALALGLMPHRRWPRVAAGAIGGALGVGGMLAWAAAGFTVQAFQEPRFTGALRRAPVVIEAVQKGEITLSQVRSRYSVAANRMTDLLAVLARPNPNPFQSDTRILHISDVHSNPLGMEIALQLARRFEVDAVLDTGDLMSFGIPLEAGIGNLVSRFDVPYLFVPGNHDSAAATRAIAGIDGVTVLDRNMTSVEGIGLLGWRDPTYTNWNRIPVEEANQQRIDEGERVVEVVRRLRPDVLAVHDPRLAQASYGIAPVVLAGHDHKERIEVRDGTLVLVVDSTGATGLKSFTVESQRAYEAQVVYFHGNRPVALDYIRFVGLGNDFEIQRRTLTDLVEPEEAP